MGKGLHKIFRSIIKKLNDTLYTFGELGSEVSHFIPETIFRSHKITRRCQKGLAKRNFERYQKFNQQPDISNGWPREGVSIDTMYECQKEKIKFYGSIEESKLIIVVRGDLQNKEMIGYIWYTISST